LAGYLDLRSNTPPLRPTGSVANTVFKLVGTISGLLYTALAIYAFFVAEWYIALGMVIVSSFLYVFIGQSIIRYGIAPGIALLSFIVGVGVAAVAIF
jgi:hypothetical protein